MISIGDLVLPQDKICPKHDSCEWQARITPEDALNVPRIRCPHAYPHNNIDCRESPCCPECIPFDQSTVILNDCNRVTKVLTNA